ncbi:hypothetical protein CF67_11013 [Candidatus Photodesmus blepharus]|uniref:Cell division coordinator CpoB n=2 Tax=Candidatus Photodesmus blepharonis TaxID=1179155 RepID=A0A084CPB5_9GAMM|nr:hypothetical protein CF67_11013 [Candidatus Photodesmus blepharus]
MLLVGAGPLFSAPAPVSDLNNAESFLENTQSIHSKERGLQRLEKLFINRNKMQLQIQKQIDEMSLEISQLRGQLEKSNYDIQQMLYRQQELFIELDQVNQVIQNTVIAKDASGSKSIVDYSNTDEQKAYQYAVDLILKKKDYSGSILILEKFQKDYPNSGFLPNVYYWLGQLYFAKKQDKKAKENFLSVITYKEYEKRSNALMKLGDIEKRNNNEVIARKYYQQVLDEYPSSALADFIKKKLKDLS